MMESWQIALGSIGGFIVAMSCLVGIVRFNHYTKKEIDDKFDAVALSHQTIPMCNNNHSNANQTMSEIKESQNRVFDKIDELKMIIIRYFGHEREEKA